MAEALERAIAEIEVLEAIYDSDFINHSKEAVAALAHTADFSAGQDAIQSQQFDVELTILTNVRVWCCLPKGYPLLCAVQIRVSVPEFNRREIDMLKEKVQTKANELVGQEAILEIVQEIDFLIREARDSRQDTETKSIEIPKTEKKYGRRWIWVHHITDTARQNAIICEARELHLNGIVKVGYPGVVLIEGTACDEFVSWIKGNKSRPGGFGRNWGHHVRGEITIQKDEVVLPLGFTKVEEMNKLASICRLNGLEDEFLEYALQHK